jgi:serine/threonine protein kinase
MDVSAYLYFCRADSLFHDVPPLDTGLFEQATAAAPRGWHRGENREWITVLPPRPLPQQGWKLHVSTTPDEAADTLDTCWEILVGLGVGFKFLKSRECVSARSSKYAERSGSGKFVTIYPIDEDELEVVIDVLGAALEGRTGPYVLSDVRWRNGPLYLRYGAFRDRSVRTDQGDLAHAIEDPEGRLVPDVRGPGFRPPAWVELPAVVEQALEDRSGSRLLDFPYRPEKALHFSNGGGVYRGSAPDGRPVLIKEARPLAGLDGAGRDAVVRLEAERWAHEQLAGMPEVPTLLDYRRGHEHYFLVREEVEGTDLQRLVLERNPLLHGASDQQTRRDYLTWVVDVMRQVEDGLAAMHARGVVWADLHPGNVLVTPEGRVRFIDFEAAREAHDTSPQFMAAPGFGAPPGHSGPAIDRYALGIMKLAVLVPIPSLLNWDGDKLPDMLALVRDQFDPPAAYLDSIWSDLELDDARNRSRPRTGLAAQVGPTAWPAPADPDPEAWTRVEDRLVSGILASATPERADRLYPGDVVQLVKPGAGLGLCHGAAGVQWVLRHTGVEVPAEHRSWLLDAVDRTPVDDPGLVDGLAGIGFALDRLGHHEHADRLLERAVDVVSGHPATRVSDGAAGVGLALLHVAATSGPERRVRLVDAATRISGGVGTETTATPAAGRPATGLLEGPAGEAAFLVALHRATGDDDLLDRAVGLLHRDLATRQQSGGPAGGPVDPRTSALLGRGGGGTAWVVAALAAHREVPELLAVRDQVEAASAVPLLLDGGLLAGRAGVMLVRHALSGPDDAEVAHHRQRLGLHAVGLGADLAVLAPLALRFSCDLATGSAGTLLAVHTVSSDQPLDLPFLPPPVADRQPAVASLTGVTR